MGTRTRPAGKGSASNEPKRSRKVGAGAGDRPDRTKKALAPLNQPYLGCCKPYPDVTFINQQITRICAVHVGPHCKGYQEPISIEGWFADVDARVAASRSGGGDE